MGKIIASYLVKVHLYADDDVSAPTNEVVKDAVIDGVRKELARAGGAEISAEVTVSLIERTDD